MDVSGDEEESRVFEEVERVGEVVLGEDGDEEEDEELPTVGEAMTV
jgi:hypothetical protein